MKKRTYGSGSFRQISDGKFELRYHGKSKTIEATGNRQADRELKKWVEERETAEASGPDVSLNHLLDLHIADKRRKSRADILPLEQKLKKHVRPALGHIDAKFLKKADLKRYIDARLSAGAQNATIDRELSAIRRALHIGVGDGLIPSVLSFKDLMLPENNARQGFVEDDIYRDMLWALPPHAQMPWVFSFYTGIRKKELLNLLWAWVDWNAWIIVIPETVTKNRKRRIIPVYAEMREHLKCSFQMRNPECPFMFQRQGKQLRSFRKAFENARRDLKVPALLFHDLRRTAVRNMERAGIQRTTARQVSGHKTESVYIRYAISAERDALEVGDRMTEFHQRERAKAAAEENCGKNCGTAPTDPETKTDELSAVN